jgi:hypothetical protein
MADKSKGGVIHKNPYNEVDSLDESKPDDSGAGMYVSYEEVIGMQLSQQDASMASTPNTMSGDGLVGGPASGEPNPFKFKPTC